MKKYDIAVAIIRDQDCIAMVKQHFQTTHNSLWSLPSGKREHNETFIDAAIRETKEETGLDIENTPQLIYICEYTNKKDNFMCHVQAYEFTRFKGETSPQDTEIERSVFMPLIQAIQKLSQLKCLATKTPIISYLNDPTQKRMRWKYDVTSAGQYKHLSTTQLI